MMMGKLMEVMMVNLIEMVLHGREWRIPHIMVDMRDWKEGKTTSSMTLKDILPFNVGLVFGRLSICREILESLIEMSF